jgi:hypothetical protein
MYPSGAWRGFWEQTFWGRQTMHPLTLRFAGGRVEGEGADVIGRFTFRGEYDASGAVTLVKKYVGRHSVLYHGRYDGEGTILGEWSIGVVRGPFALSPERFTVPEDAPILTVGARPGAEDAGDDRTSPVTVPGRRRGAGGHAGR